jgi:hypothetical protein
MVNDLFDLLEAAKTEKKVLRGEKKAEREANQLKAQQERDEKIKRQFSEDTKDWDKRLIRVLLGYSTYSGFEVSTYDEDKIRFLYEDGSDIEVVRVPTRQHDIWALESVEQALQDYKDEVAEQKRIYKIRVDALAKLSVEEKKALGF